MHCSNPCTVRIWHWLLNWLLPYLWILDTRLWGKVYRNIKLTCRFPRRFTSTGRWTGCNNNCRRKNIATLKCLHQAGMPLIFLHLLSQPEQPLCVSIDWNAMRATTLQNTLLIINHSTIHLLQIASMTSQVQPAKASYLLEVTSKK